MKRSVFLFLFGLLIIFSISLLFPGNLQQAWERIKLEIIGRLEVGEAAPDIQYIYMDNTQLPTSPPGILFDGDDDDNVTYRLNATVYDNNGNCDGGFTWFVCTNDTLDGGPCSATLYTYTVDNETAAVKYGAGLYCNYTATFPLEYYRRCGISNIYGRATDVAGNTDSETVYWRYNGMLTLYYPYTGYEGQVDTEIDYGLVSIGWNNGTTARILKNGGNMQFDANWNATDFENATIPWTIDVTGNDNYGLDTDDQPGGESWIPNPPTQVQFPTWTVKRCGNFDCSEDQDAGANEANFTSYWDMNIPTGTPSGIYNNTIEVSPQQVTQC